MVKGAEWMSLRAELSCHKTNQNVETRKNGPEGTREAVVRPSARRELGFLSICKVFYCPLWKHPRHRNSPAFLFLPYMKLSDFHMSTERWKGRDSELSEVWPELPTVALMSPWVRTLWEWVPGAQLTSEQRHPASSHWRIGKTRTKPHKTPTE